MTLLNSIFPFLRSIQSGKVLVLILALAFASWSQATAAEEIILNTGLVGQISTNPLIPFLQLDDDWRVTADPIFPTPRSAYVVSNTTVTGSHIGWPAPFLNSLWISGAANWYMGSLPPPRTSFTYQSCFSILQFYSAPKLEMYLRGDDIIRRVKLNSTTIFEDSDPDASANAAKAGSHLGPPLQITWTTPTDFHIGQNCLEVVVEDVDRLISGLNVVAAVTYQPPILVGVPVSGICLHSGQVVQTDLSTGTTNGIKNALAAVDPKWTLLSVPPTGAAGAAYSTGTTGSWVLNSAQQANWIQPIQNVTPQSNGYAGPIPYSYEAQIDTSPYSSIQLQVRYAADNSAVVRLNGSQVATCGPNCFSNWQPVPMQTLNFPIPNPSYLNVFVTNNAAFTGLIVDATLFGTCK